MTKRNIIPIFVPHLGCPHDCIFCNQKKITGLTTNIRPEDVENIINEHLGYFRKDSYVEVAFYGGSFTAIDMDIQSSLLEIPKKYKDKGIIDEIRCSTRPDAIDNDILSNLKKYGMDTIELGVQSLDEEVLLKSERDHGVQEVYKAVDLIRAFGFNLGLQMMLGLPSDSIQKSLNTCLEFIKLNPDCVRIYPTLVIKDTFLEKEYLKKEYNPLSMDEAVEWSSLILMLFKIKDINVIRVGLQPTENIQLGRDVVAGPFHPAFRQLAEGNIYRLLLEKYLRDKLTENERKDLIIYANKSQISLISGQRSSNINYLRGKFKFKKIKIFSKDMNSDFIAISIGDFHDKINMKTLIKDYISEHSIIKKIKGFQ